MARTGVTEIQVHQAADTLLRAGERPTIERVRALLGTGSPNTLIRLLETWWVALGERLTAHEAKLALPGAPPEVVSAASALWTGAMAHATALAQAEIERDRTALQHQRAALEASERDLRIRVDQAESDSREAAEARSLAEGRYADLDRLVQHLAVQQADIKSQRDALMLEREDLSQRLATVERRLADLAESAIIERRAMEAQHRIDEDRWLQEVDRSRQDKAKLQSQLSKVENAAQVAAQRALKENESLRTTVRTTERALAASDSRATTLEREVTRLLQKLSVPASVANAGSRKPSAAATPKRQATTHPKIADRAAKPTRASAGKRG